jgi:hypothetical protein
MKAALLMVALASVATTVAPIGPASAGEWRTDARDLGESRADTRGADESRADARGVVIGTQSDSGVSSWVDTQYGERHGRRGGPDAELFSNSDFRGDRWVISGDYMPDLANTGFNDRAQSLRVRHGYWIFCSDSQFRGQCRTFGPGDYPRLGWALDNKVSSGRRISERYPYAGQPNWGDRR